MQPTLLNQGVELLVYGMGTVIVFLTLLVYATGAMSRTILRFFPEPAIPASAAPRRELPVEAQPVPAARLAVITAAIHRYRQDHRR